MPQLREQHNQPTINPFEELKPHVSEYTAAEIATLSRRLEKQLGPEYISSRAGPGGGKVHYLSADKCIGLANEVFGFNGWSSSIQTIQIDFVDENDQGRISLGLSVTLRVTLRDGTFHEDIGYGHIENCKGKAAAFEKAKKEGTTDALKRALRNFGNLLGNCIYDKEYVAKVTKIKAGPVKWDPNNLHRHPSFAPLRKDFKAESARQQSDLQQTKQEAPAYPEETLGVNDRFAEDEFGSDDFDAVDFAVSDGDHPDEVELDGKKSSVCTSREPDLPVKKTSLKAQSVDRLHVPKISSPSKKTGPQTPDMMLEHPKLLPTIPDPPKVSNSAVIQSYHSHQSSISHPAKDLASMNAVGTFKDEPPVGFFTARAAESVQAQANPAMKAPLFNPRLESPSIRKTAGIDHTKTKPVHRDLTEAAPPALTTATGTKPRGSIVDLQSDRTRRVGMPIGTASPLQSRSSYRSPQLKRPGEGAALSDVTAASINAGCNIDPKRAKRSGAIGAEAQIEILNN